MDYTPYIGIALFLLLILVFFIIFRAKKKKKSESADTKALPEKLSKTKNSFLNQISQLLQISSKVDEKLIEELEDILLQADIGVKTTGDIITSLRERIKEKKITEVEAIRSELRFIIEDLMSSDYSENENHLVEPTSKPHVILFVGVNGVGKTTTIGKLAYRYKQQGRSVMMIAGDTFRAAAIEQLTIWSERAGVEIVKQKQGSDAAAVIYDGLTAAIHRKIDVVLIDTAGRQHTKVNLMNELRKVVRTIKKVIPEAPHESLLVVDATTGQNALAQADLFNEAVTISGIVLSKLDGTAKGGIVIGIKHQYNLPVKLIGVGEKISDLKDFQVKEFISALFD
jgi:fused signal recognition particle receptor